MNVNPILKIILRKLRKNKKKIRKNSKYKKSNIGKIKK